MSAHSWGTQRARVCPCFTLPQKERDASPPCFHVCVQAKRAGDCGEPRVFHYNYTTEKNESTTEASAQEEILSLSLPLRKCHVLGCRVVTGNFHSSP